MREIPVHIDVVMRPCTNEERLNLPACFIEPAAQGSDVDEIGSAPGTQTIRSLFTAYSRYADFSAW